MEAVEEHSLEDTNSCETKHSENSETQGMRRSQRRKRSSSMRVEIGDYITDHYSSSRRRSRNSSQPNTAETDASNKKRTKSMTSETAGGDTDASNQSEQQDSTSDLSYEKGVKKFSCKLCSAAFTSNSYLTVHKRMHSGEKPYRCQYPDCSAAFIAAGSLRRHENTHTKAKSYVCPDCGDTFTQSSSLNTHRRRHTGDCPFQCGVCPRTFVSSSHLKKHLQMHSGEKPHVCGQCGADFRNAHNLKRHLMIHSGERPFMCRECGDAFITKDDLKRHSQVHSIRKQFPCRYCPAAFSRSGRLRRHERSKHPSDAPEVRLARECLSAFVGDGGMVVEEGGGGNQPSPSDEEKTSGEEGDGTVRQGSGQQHGVLFPGFSAELYGGRDQSGEADVSAAASFQGSCAGETMSDEEESVNNDSHNTQSVDSDCCNTNNDYHNSQSVDSGDRNPQSVHSDSHNPSDISDFDDPSPASNSVVQKEIQSQSPESDSEPEDV
ncbi:uncharacterized protein LOC143276388 [Babylonia areolata]|uniref:uncharacterized protein LOC143276388 n=1 Tax=Babylonia areolata TaxID=304850 RepID=UPI003FD67459